MSICCIKILRSIALRIAAIGTHDPAADVSGDSRITSLDALMIMQAAAGA